MKPTIITSTGLVFDFLSPHADMIHIHDIAHALSHVCRFAGHTQEFYSVAQHSVMVSHAVPPRLAMVGLLHDATEAYIGDVTSPLKMLLPDYQVIEANIHRVIFERFGLEPDMPNEIKIADLQMLKLEREKFIPHCATEVWEHLDGIPRLHDGFLPGTWNSPMAKIRFLRRFSELQREAAEAGR